MSDWGGASSTLNDRSQETFPHTRAAERALLRTSDHMTRRWRVQIPPPRLEKPRRRGSSELESSTAGATSCPILAMRAPVDLLQLCSWGLGAQPLGDSACPEEQDEQSRPLRHVLMLVRHDLR